MVTVGSLLLPGNCQRCLANGGVTQCWLSARFLLRELPPRDNAHQGVVVRSLAPCMCFVLFFEPGSVYRVKMPLTLASCQRGPVSEPGGIGWLLRAVET